MSEATQANAPDTTSQSPVTASQSPVTTLQTPVQPREVARDPQPPRVTNVIRYNEASAGHSIDQYSEDIPNGNDAARIFREAVESKVFNKKAIRAVAILSGGHRVGRKNSVHGGNQLASWSEEGGKAFPTGWENKLVNYDPSIVAPPPEPMTTESEPTPV